MGNTEAQMRREKSQDLFIRILFIVLWTRSTIMPYVAQVFRRLPVVGGFYEHFTTMVILVLFILTFRKIIKKIMLFDVLFFLTLALAILLSLSIYPENAEYIDPELSDILFSVLPMYLFGVCYNHGLVKTDLYIASISALVMQGLILGLAVQAKESGYGYDMQSAYIALPNAMYVLYWAFEKKKLLTWVPPILSFILLVAYGTRGALLAFFLYYVALILVNAISQKKVIKVVFLLILALLLIAIITSSLFLQFVENAAEVFNEVGLSTRIFDKIIEGEMADDSGRAFISERIWGVIGENWLFGKGFMGDRSILDGSYSHNLFLELLCSFGLFFGTIAILALISISVSALRKTYLKPEFRFVMLLITFVFGKLMFSWSYALEPYFYFMLGVCVAMRRKYKEKGIDLNESTEKLH